ncbi:hypothetical protein GSF70_10300 [Flavobacteriaceae bacterium W22]|nr:hypothetical protein [Flavobacteriaceae bacterium W22]
MKNQFIFEGYPHEILLRLKALRISQSENNELGKSNKAVIENNLLWNKDILSVSFKGGDFNLINNIATVAQEWTKYANIKFDFGIDQNKKTFRKWVNGDSSDIRIGFEDKGYWSFVGTEALNLELCPPGSLTMNLENFNIQLPTNWKRLILHEFGHALGFHHEHQSPTVQCDFDFDKLYADMSQLGWSKEQVDYNFQQLSGHGLYFTKHDPLSIMHYAYDEEYYESGKNSPCFINSENHSLSNSDKVIANKAYPYNKPLKGDYFRFSHNEEISNISSLAELGDGEDMGTRIIEAILRASGNWITDPNSINPTVEKISDHIKSQHARDSMYTSVEEIIMDYNKEAEVHPDDLAEFEIFQEVIDYAFSKI